MLMERETRKGLLAVILRRWLRLRKEMWKLFVQEIRLLKDGRSLLGRCWKILLVIVSRFRAIKKGARILRERLLNRRRSL